MTHILAITKKQLLEMAETLELSWNVQFNGKFAYAGQRTLNLVKRVLTDTRKEIRDCAKGTSLEAWEQKIAEVQQVARVAMAQAKTADEEKAMAAVFNEEIAAAKTALGVTAEDEEKVKPPREKLLAEQVSIEVFKLRSAYLPDNITMAQVASLQPMLTDE